MRKVTVSFNVTNKEAKTFEIGIGAKIDILKYELVSIIDPKLEMIKPSSATLGKFKKDWNYVTVFQYFEKHLNQSKITPQNKSRQSKFGTISIAMKKHCIEKGICFIEPNGKANKYPDHIIEKYLKTKADKKGSK